MLWKQHWGWRRTADICGIGEKVALACKAMSFLMKELCFCQRKRKRFNEKFEDEKRDFLFALDRHYKSEHTHG